MRCLLLFSYSFPWDYHKGEGHKIEVQAIDSGRKSGHGRVVLLYFELCQSIWGGSPATEQIEGGVESANIGSSTAEAGGRHIISTMEPPWMITW